jgi:hypothetical protein
MQLVSSITHRVILLFCVGVATILTTANAQENSPYSRYGLGDFFYGNNIVQRGMAGLSTAYSDGVSNNLGQAVNPLNPASYANFKIISYDIGTLIETRNLSSRTAQESFRSNNFIPSYVFFGTPLDKKKDLGFAFGIRPLSRINYAVSAAARTTIDSTQTLFEGTGGLNQAFVGIGKRFKNLSIGFNTGYNFGSKNISTKKAFINDTVAYASALSSSNTQISGLFFSYGLQYQATIKKGTNSKTKTQFTNYVRIGLSGTLGNKLNGNQDVSKETFALTNTGAVVQIDSVFKQNNISGTIQMPANHTAGLVFGKIANTNRGVFDLWQFGVEYNMVNWSNYKFYNQQDAVTNAWQLRVGGQFTPNPITGTSYWNNVVFRAGTVFGKDYINADGNGLRTFGITLGAGLPIKKYNNYTYQFTIINIAAEFGNRGSAVNNITENYFRLSVGLSLSDLWFIKRKYD